MGTHLQSLKSNLQIVKFCSIIKMAARQLIARSPALRMGLASRSMATSPVQRDIDTAAKFIGAGIATVFGSLIIGYARNPSLKQQLFSYAILGFALSEAMGLFCLMMAF